MLNSQMVDPMTCYSEVNLHDILASNADNSQMVDPMTCYSEVNLQDILASNADNLHKLELTATKFGPHKC